MSTSGAVEWRIKGDHAGTCNCVWACPCQFNALPDKGNCEALLVWEISEGHFGDVSLDGVRFGFAIHWPGAVHEGNGTRQFVVDPGATPEQREALNAMYTGKYGGTYFEIYASTVAEEREPTVGEIELNVDRGSRRGSFRIAGLGDAQVEPIVNPDIGPDEKQVRIELPNGFEYEIAEIADSAKWSVTAEAPLAFSHEHTYAQLYDFDWSNA